MNTGCVLVVEDNQDDQLLTLRALRKQGFDNPIVVKNDGVEALEFLQDAVCDEDSKLPALIVMDLKMPRVDGHEVLKQLKGDSRFRQIPVVLLTSSREIRDVTCAYDLGANSYVRKPVDSQKFNDVAHYLCQYWLDINETAAAFEG